jgi:PLP dependent protein
LASSAEQIAARLARIREEIGPEVTIVAATKYVSVEDMATLAEAGIDIVGENRAQDL